METIPEHKRQHHTDRRCRVCFGPAWAAVCRDCRSWDAILTHVIAAQREIKRQRP